MEQDKIRSKFVFPSTAGITTMRGWQMFAATLESYDKRIILSILQSFSDAFAPQYTVDVEES